MPGLTIIPTRTDDSIGRRKTETPRAAWAPPPSLDYYHTADEHERIKDAVIGLAEEVGAHDGSTAGSLVARVVTLEAAGGASALVDGDFAGTHAGILTRTGAGSYSTIRIAVSVSAPGASDDGASGYTAGSMWRQTSTETPGYETLWLCANPLAGAAEWARVLQPATAAPPSTARASALGVSPYAAREDHTHDDGERHPSATITAATYALDDTKDAFFVSTASNNVRVDLPTLTTCRNYGIWKVNTGTNKITLRPPAGVQINAGTAGVDFDLPSSSNAAIRAWHIIYQPGVGWWVT